MSVVAVVSIISGNNLDAVTIIRIISLGTVLYVGFPNVCVCQHKFHSTY